MCRETTPRRAVCRAEFEKFEKFEEFEEFESSIVLKKEFRPEKLSQGRPVVSNTRPPHLIHSKESLPPSCKIHGLCRDRTLLLLPRTSYILSLGSPSVRLLGVTLSSSFCATSAALKLG